MPFRATFDCLWCGAAHVCRGPDDLEGWAQLCPELRRQGRRQRLPAVPPPPGADRAGRGRWRRRPSVAPQDGRGRPEAASRVSRRRPPTAPMSTPRCSPTTRPGRPNTTTGISVEAATPAGPIHDAAWNAELDVAGRWLDELPIHGEIVELAAGTGWWSPLLASKGELSLYDGAPGSARPGARAPGRPPAARPPPRPRRVGRARSRGRRRVHRLLAEPRPARSASTRSSRSSGAGSSPAGRSPSSTRCPIRNRARPTIPRPPTMPRSAAWPTAASSRSSRSTTRLTSSSAPCARPGSSTRPSRRRAASS